MGRFLLFWRGEALLGVSLFVCLYFSGPKKLLLLRRVLIANPSPLGISNGSPCVGVVLVLMLLEDIIASV